MRRLKARRDRRRGIGLLGVVADAGFGGMMDGRGHLGVFGNGLPGPRSRSPGETCGHRAKAKVGVWEAGHAWVCRIGHSQGQVLAVELLDAGGEICMSSECRPRRQSCMLKYKNGGPCLLPAGYGDGCHCSMIPGMIRVRLVVVMSRTQFVLLAESHSHEGASAVHTANKMGDGCGLTLGQRLIAVHRHCVLVLEAWPCPDDCSMSTGLVSCGDVMGFVEVITSTRPISEAYRLLPPSGTH